MNQNPTDQTGLGAPFKVGGWEIRPDDNTACRGDEVRRLEARAVAVLAYLHRHRDRVVSKGELLDAVWQRAAISDHSVAVVISDLRRALGDDSRQPRYIRTIPRKGYRLIAEDLPQDSHGESREETSGETDGPPMSGMNDAVCQPPPRPAAPSVPSGSSTWIPASQASQAAPKPPHALQPNASRAHPGSSRPGNRRPVILSLAVAGVVAGLLTLVLMAPQIGARNEGGSVQGPPVPFTTLEGRPITPAFSPDGGTVVFAWNKDARQDFDLYVKALGAPDMRRLLDSDHFDAYPAFSPKGNRIAFIRRGIRHGERPFCSVHIVSAVGGADQKVGDCLSQITLSVAWTRDGSGLIYPTAMDGDMPRSRIVHLDLETGNVTPLTDPPPGTLGDTMAALSHDGSKLAIRREVRAFTSDIYVLDLTPDGQPKAPLRRLTRDKDTITDLNWSPDGRDIVFTSSRDGPFSVWRISRDGGNPTQMVHTSAYVHGVAIAPNGRTLILDQRDEGTNISINRIPPPAGQEDEDTQDRETPELEPDFVISSTRFDWDADLSPDGRRLVFISDRTSDARLWTADVDGSRLRPITNRRRIGLESPVFSPDGTRIAYAATVDDNADIYVTDADGRDHRRITTHPESDTLPVWSADGSTLYFSSSRAGEYFLHAVDLETGTIRQLTDQPTRALRILADGRILACGIRERKVVAVDPETGGVGVLSATLPSDAGHHFDVAGGHLYFLTAKADGTENAQAGEDEAAGPTEKGSRTLRRRSVLHRRPLTSLNDPSTDEVVAVVNALPFMGYFRISADESRIVMSVISRYDAQLYRMDYAF